jgi:hypothetical protein
VTSSVRPEPVEGLSFSLEERRERASTSSARTGEGTKPLSPLLLRVGERGFGRRRVHRADILAAGRGAARLAGQGRVGDGVAIEADGAAGVVVAGTGKGDALRAGVRIEDRDDRDAEARSLP